MAGDEPAQLHGDNEVVAVAGDELMPCAVAVLRSDNGSPRALVETSTCRQKYPEGFTAAALGPLSRRAEIERAELIRKTYADFADRGRGQGLSESAALLRAGEEMSRLGLFPKTTQLIANSAECDADPVFDISDEEFRAGLFQDIERAIASPGVEVPKSMGTYIRHRDYATSRRINERIEAGDHELMVRTAGKCWRLTIVRP
jgi:hypothetical protein